MVFDATFTQEIPEDRLDQSKEALEEYLDEDTAAESMGDMLDVLEKAGVKNPKVKVIYRTLDGDILAEKTYTVN